MEVMSSQGVRTARLPVFMFLAVLLFPGSPDTAAATPRVQIDFVGPFGGSVRSLLVSRHDAMIAYLGTSDGQVLKSIDGGRSWKPLYPGIGKRHLVVDALAEDPSRAGHLFAGAWDLRSHGGGLFESGDGGQHWAQVALPRGAAAVRGVGISRGKPNRMIAGTLSGAYVSENAGRTWREVKDKDGAFTNVESVAIGPQDPNLVFIGTWHLGYRSKNFGQTWERNSKGMMSDSDMFSIAIDETNQKVVYASACTGVYRSANEGVSWMRLRIIPSTFVIRTQIVYIDPADSHRIYAGTTQGLHVSENDGRNWRLLTSNHLIVNAIAVDSRDSRKILVGTDQEGILRSEDGGRTWIPSNTGFAARRVSRIVPIPGKDDDSLTGLLSDGGNGGFYLFDEGRGEWVPRPGGLKPGTQILSFLALPRVMGRLFGTPQGIFLERPGSGEWSKLPGIIGQLAINDMAFDGENHWVFAGTNKGIYRARPETLDFQKPAGYRLLPRVSSLVVSPSSPKIVFAATHMGLLRSADQGATWDIIYSGLPAETLVECLTVDPADSSHLFAGTAAGLFESKDGGAGWREIPLGGSGVHVPAVIFPEPHVRRVVAANQTLAGVWVSEDGGATWERLDTPELRSPVQCMAPDPTRPSSIFLGTQSEGIYRLQFRDGRAGRMSR